MKIAPFSEFRKTWGIINTDVPKGKYQFKIDPKWDSHLYNGQKWFGLTTTNKLGAENYFLGYAFITIGTISILLSIIFMIRKLQRPKGILDKKFKEASETESEKKNER